LWTKRQKSWTGALADKEPDIEIDGELKEDVELEENDTGDEELGPGGAESGDWFWSDMLCSQPVT
jgi:hypothetical protein